MSGSAAGPAGRCRGARARCLLAALAQWWRGRARRVRARPPPMSPVEAVISDFGGVLTSPLVDSFAAFQESSGISLEDLGLAMAAVAARDGANPLFELETGRITEAAFLGSLAAQLTDAARPADRAARLRRALLRAPAPERADDRLHARAARRAGYRLAICTNNVPRVGAVAGGRSCRSTRSSTSSSTRRSSEPASPSRGSTRSRSSGSASAPDAAVLHRRHRDSTATPRASSGSARCGSARPSRRSQRSRRRSPDRRSPGSVLAAEPIPAVELEALARELDAALVGEPRQYRVERLLLPDARLERLLAAEPGGDLQRLATVLAERREAR